MRLIIISSLLLIAVANYAQSYTSYFTGSSTNVTTQPDGGICLMGGATENDEAMKWFLQRANGGDILVLRASGSDGYNDYLYAELGVAVNSVETIVFNTADAVNDFYVQTRIQNAEAIWFAGGDQWNYVNYWKNSPVETLVNNSIQQRNIVIGGTSAGMAILGSHYFSAQNGTVTSATALANPFHNLVSIGGNDFLNAGVLSNTITDTHYDNPDRRGRHVVFMARMATDFAIEPRGIACDEYTAVCIDGTLARVYGNYPSDDDNAYFVQMNCELQDRGPEVCTPGTPLTWNRDGKALRVFRVKGTQTGQYFFDWAEMYSESEGDWLYWYVDNGVFHETPGEAYNCNIGKPDIISSCEVTISPNPVGEYLNISTGNIVSGQILIFDITGKTVYSGSFEGKHLSIDTGSLLPGMYVVELKSDAIQTRTKLLKL